MRVHAFAILALSIVPVLACPGPRDHAVQTTSPDGPRPGNDGPGPTDARLTDQGGATLDGPQMDGMDPPVGLDMGGPAAEVGPSGCGAPGKTCAGSMLQVCGTDGTLTSTPCANGCSAVRLECNTCRPNERVCSGNALVVCNGEGAATTMMACTSGCNITLNECNGCTPNSRWCSGNTLRECTAGGMPMDLQTCAQGCNATRLECNACNPSDAPTCSGNSVRTCRTDGSGTMDQACATPTCSGQTRTVPTCRSGRCDQDNESCNGYGCSGTSCRTTCASGTIRSGGACVSCGDNGELCCGGGSPCSAGACSNNHCCPNGQQWNTGASRCEASCSDIMCSNGRCPRQTGSCLAIGYRPNVSGTSPSECGEPNLCTPPATGRCVADAVRAAFMQVNGNDLDVVEANCFGRTDEMINDVCMGNSGGRALLYALTHDANGAMSDAKVAAARSCP